MALFSRADRTFNLELERQGAALVERLHVGEARPQRSEHGSEDDAFHAYKQRLVELVADGWSLSVGDDDISRTVARDPAIEAAVARDPSAEQLAVYADWLIERGDPCGELAALRARAERAPDPELAAALAAGIRELEQAHADELFGLLAALPNDQINLVWRHGWVEAIEISSFARSTARGHPDSPTGTLVALALLAPIARFADRLEITRLHTEAVRSAIAMSPRRNAIKRLGFAASNYAQELLDVLPALEHLAMPAGATTTRGHDQVHTISLRAGIERPDELLRGEWPALETLVVIAERDVSGALATLAERPFTRTLKRLQIRAPIETPIVRVLREALPGVAIDANP